MIQQAVLNAVPKHLPHSSATFGVAGTLRRLNPIFCVSHDLERHIRHEFRIIANRYEAAQ